MAGFHFSRTKWIALAAVILITAAAVWFFYFRSDDAALVRERLREAAEFIGKQPGNNLQIAGMIRTLDDFFTEDAEVTFSGNPDRTFVHSISGRNTIESAYVVLRPMASSLTVTLSEVSISFQDLARKTATVRCLALVTGSIRDGRDFNEGRMVSAEMVRESDGIWRFRSLSAETVLVLDN